MNVFVLYSADRAENPGSEYILGVFSTKEKAICGAQKDANLNNIVLSERDIAHLKRHHTTFRKNGEGRIYAINKVKLDNLPI